MKKHLCENIVGYPITAREKDDCVKQILAWIKSGEMRRYFVCANPHSLELARRDLFFKNAIRHADMITPDGIGVIIASKIHGGSICDRVTGSDIFWGLSHALNQERGYRYFFLGSTEETLAAIQDKMKTYFPNIEVAGTLSPPFRSEFNDGENGAMIQTINRAKPHVLWVGMTAPKQEKWIYKNRDKLEVRLIGPVGAVFDFFAGTAKRSGQWFQDHGYEWLPRLLRNPRRLWYRNFVTFPMFVFRNVIIRIMDSGKQSTTETETEQSF
jgi:N-acetylglucosaminyldiphosphoundecaprenol N-acetyl-beta-D-mannosaminyltransferase